MTTLTKRTAEELTDYLRDIGINVRYLHSEIDAIERVEILRSLRKGEFDVLVGINLLREGLDLPEVSLVAILDADKEGYLRSATSLIQTAGRAARHLNGEVILYADVMTQSIQKFLAVSEYRRDETNRLQQGTQHHAAQCESRRGRQPGGLHKRETESRDGLERRGGNIDVTLKRFVNWKSEMITASNNLEFEKAALLRDQIRELKRSFGDDASGAPTSRPVNYKQSKRGKKRRG